MMRGQLHQPPEVSSAFLDYYHSLFSSSDPTGVEECLDVLQEKVTPEMNEQLTSRFTSEEVCTAISQMSPYKSPGPDGFPHASTTSIGL
jgi:hypothetical protein